VTSRRYVSHDVMVEDAEDSLLVGRRYAAGACLSYCLCTLVQEDYYKSNELSSLKVGVMIGPSNRNNHRQLLRSVNI